MRRGGHRHRPSIRKAVLLPMGASHCVEHTACLGAGRLGQMGVLSAGEDDIQGVWLKIENDERQDCFEFYCNVSPMAFFAILDKTKLNAIQLANVLFDLKTNNKIILSSISHDVARRKLHQWCRILFDDIVEESVSHNPLALPVPACCWEAVQSLVALRSAKKMDCVDEMKDVDDGVSFDMLNFETPVTFVDAVHEETMSASRYNRPYYSHKKKRQCLTYQALVRRDVNNNCRIIKLDGPFPAATSDHTLLVKSEVQNQSMYHPLRGDTLYNCQKYKSFCISKKRANGMSKQDGVDNQLIEYERVKVESPFSRIKNFEVCCHPRFKSDAKTGFYFHLCAAIVNYDLFYRPLQFMLHKTSYVKRRCLSLAYRSMRMWLRRNPNKKRKCLTTGHRNHVKRRN